MTPDNLRDVLAEDGPECDLCGKTTCPDADLAEFSDPVACPYARIYENLRYDRCEYGCGRDVTKTAIRRDIAPTVARLIADARAEAYRANPSEGQNAAWEDGYAQGRTEQAAADRERIEALLHPERGMGVSVYGDGRRFFDEADIRAALDSEGGA
jgi:hypothetical protein